MYGKKYIFIVYVSLHSIYISSFCYTNVITCARFCLKQTWWLGKAMAEMKCEHWAKKWNGSSCTELFFSVIVQSVRASDRNSVVMDVCVRACMRACMCVCVWVGVWVRACMRACVRACVRVYKVFRWKNKNYISTLCFGIPLILSECWRFILI